MRRRFRRVGWHHFVNTQSAPLIKRVQEKKDHLLPLTSEVVAEATKTSFETYVPERLKEFGLLKSVLRGLLRYDPDVKRLGASIATEVASGLSERSDALYCTPPYPYLHFPQDRSESSALHIDEEGYEGEFFTAWVPLQTVRDQPITIIPRSHRRLHANRVLSWMERKAHLPKIPWFYKRSVSPDVDLGNFLVWTGRTHHSGNLNASTRPRVVLNFRMSTEPEMLEPSCRIRDLAGSGNGASHDEPKDDPLRYAKKYLSIFQALERANLFAKSSSLTLAAALKQTDDLIAGWSLKGKDRKRVAFGLALGTMRRKSTDPDVAFINFVAALLEPEYLWPLNSFVEYARTRYSMPELATFLQEYAGRHPSVQVAHAIRKLASEHPGLAALKVPADADLKLLTWN